MTWEELHEKYPMYRDDMTRKQEISFVNKCYDLYEEEGFAKVFWSMGGDFPDYQDKPFKVIRRATLEECDLECLPMWKIEFENGESINAYPDEIIPSEMIANGCKLKVK